MAYDEIDLEMHLEAFLEESRIRCPHCGHVQELDTTDLAEYGLITYWGEADDGGSAENVTELECQRCEHDFLARENVSRTFDTAKLGEEFD